MLRSLFGWIDFPLLNQMLIFFNLVMVAVIMVLLVLEIKSPFQQRAEDLAVCVSVATTATVAAYVYVQAPRKVDTFNQYQYRYFSNRLLAPSSDYLKSKDTSAFGRS